MANPNPKTENLNKFTKGKSGNPSGRRKGSKNRATLLKKYLNVAGEFRNPVLHPDRDSLEVENLTPHEVMVLAQIRRAMNGNLSSYVEIQDTLFGKLADKVEVEQNQASVSIYIPDNNRDNTSTG
jgi:hypothetical protein